MLSLDGGDETEYEYILDQLKAMACKIITSPFSRYDAEVIYRERWIASIGYCLHITQFIAIQCDNIQKSGYNSILPKMGLNRHFPRDVIFGPLKFQGKQLTDYKVYQYTSHLVRFVGYLRLTTELGNLLRIQMDQH